MLRGWNHYTLLIEMQNSAPALENSMAVPQEIKNTELLMVQQVYIYESDVDGPRDCHRVKLSQKEKNRCLILMHIYEIQQKLV